MFQLLRAQRRSCRAHPLPWLTIKSRAADRLVNADKIRSLVSHSSFLKRGAHVSRSAIVVTDQREKIQGEDTKGKIQGALVYGSRGLAPSLAQGVSSTFCGLKTISHDSMNATVSPIISATETHVRHQIESAGNDSSHDWWHIVRVRNLAIRLAKDEGLAADQLEVVQLAALLHDLHDWKYSGSATAGAEAAMEFLQSQAYDPECAARVVSVIQRIGFKDELQTSSEPMFPELAVVQDADRLDAMGAIGIARCLTFGGHFNRVLHDPEVKPRAHMTKEQYTDKSFKQTTMNHFPEKLLKLKDMMKTDSGKRMAECRHTIMVNYIDSFYKEWEGQA